MIRETWCGIFMSFIKLCMYGLNEQHEQKFSVCIPNAQEMLQRPFVKKSVYRPKRGSRLSFGEGAITNIFPD